MLIRYRWLVIVTEIHTDFECSLEALEVHCGGLCMDTREVVECKESYECVSCEALDLVRSFRIFCWSVTRREGEWSAWDERHVGAKSH